MNTECPICLHLFFEATSTEHIEGNINYIPISQEESGNENDGGSERKLKKEERQQLIFDSLCKYSSRLFFSLSRLLRVLDGFVSFILQSK